MLRSWTLTSKASLRSTLLIPLAALLVLGGPLGPSAQAQNVTPQIIDECDSCRPYGVHSADVDGDGDMDVLSASDKDDRIAWYENDGTQNFTAHTITTNADFATSVYAVDMDGDSDMDVLSASVEDDKIAWYENDGSENFTPHTISTNASSTRDVFAADLNGDSEMDVLSANFGSDEVVWYENDGDENFTVHTITTDADGPRSVYAVDMDGDSDVDVLSASVDDDKVAWYKNDGRANFAAHTITTDARGARSVYAADVNGDSEMDVLSGSYKDDKVAWYENDGGESFTSHTITTNASNVREVIAADVNGDSHVDVLSASGQDDKIAWYRNDGSGAFTANTITTWAQGAKSVHAADVDGDADVDVLSASSDDGKIAWYENTDSTLPVELVSLQTQVDRQAVRLSWETASETGNNGFYVQHRGPQADSWQQLGFVESKANGGTTTEAKSYRFRAEDLEVGTHTFRLRQVDVDGSAHFHGPVTAELQMQKRVRLNTPAPNPARQQATLSFAVKDEAETTVRLYNVLGQEVETLYQGTPAAGESQTVRLDATDLSSGMYVLRLQTNGMVKTRKMTVVR